IPLYLYAARQGVYSLSFENFDIPEWEGYHLFDTETGEFISVQSGKTYQFQVSAAPYESGKRFLLSRQIALQTENTVQLSVYPNPVQDRLFIEWQGHSLQAIKLLDALGRQVQSIDFRVENGKTYAELDMQNFEKGFYLLQFLEGKRVKTHKLIKQ
ncbi:MAG TPA: T9SS type A sorting domain-containing protein, partial [Cyclobacteriaceae bacterium]|nr:T9SS type A sorting domain-containing protein [Cyclobacteriaceae bacterium]